ncbi:MAG: hypothetical protein D6688_12690 [Alphaproteobacteria bacterium]|nr:MAG: hypothetical protein D6688_12690 [Alphaproteobacteria bacterium]
MTARSDSAPPVCIIGDSHVSAYAVDADIVDLWPAVVPTPIPGLSVCRLGAQLAGTLHRASSTGGRDKALRLLDRLAPGTAVFFLFGEIDCRAHVVRRAGHDDARIPESVAGTVANYAAFLRLAKTRAEARGLGPVGVISPPPTATAPPEGARGGPIAALAGMARGRGGRLALRLLRKVFPRGRRMRAAIGYTLNYAGTPAQRRQASALFNARRRAEADALGLAFVDGHDPFLGPDGWPDPGAFWDTVHLRHAAVFRLAPGFAAQGLPNLSMAAEAAGAGTAGAGTAGARPTNGLSAPGRSGID